MRPLATREQTVVILLPEESSAERAKDTPSLDDRVCSLSPPFSSTQAFEDAQTGLGSSLYSTNNSSSDTIPENHSDGIESAFPLITLIKPGDHNKDQLTGDTKTGVPIVRLEDTVQDLELSAEFNIEYTHTPPSHRPQTAGESPSKRRLSGRSNSHRRVKSETSGVSSPFSPGGFTIQEVSETESNPQLVKETAAPSNEATVSQTSSSAYLSSVDSPSSFILPYSQSLPKYHDLCAAMDEKADTIEMPTATTSPLKRRARAESECEGLSYAKRTKHAYTRRPATALDTIIISSSPTNSDEEDATARLSNPLVAGLMSSPSYEISPIQDIERQQELDDTVYRLKRHLSFSEALSVPHDLGSPSDLGCSHIEELQGNADIQAIAEESCQIRIEIEHKDCVDSKQHKRVISDKLEVREISTNLDVRSSFEMHVKDELTIPSSTIDPTEDKSEGQSYEILPPVECHTSTNYSVTADSQKIELEASQTVLSSNLSPLKLESTTMIAHRISKKRRGPILRVGLSKLAPVESLHSYLRKRKA